MNGNHFQKCSLQETKWKETSRGSWQRSVYREGSIKERKKEEEGDGLMCSSDAILPTASRFNLFGRCHSALFDAFAYN